MVLYRGKLVLEKRRRLWTYTRKYFLKVEKIMDLYEEIFF